MRDRTSIEYSYKPVRGPYDDFQNSSKYPNGSRQYAYRTRTDIVGRGLLGLVRGKHKTNK